LVPRKRRVKKIREEEFGEELEEAMFQKNTELENKIYSTKFYRQRY